MKKILYLMPFALLGLFACGNGGESTGEDESTEKASTMKGAVTDLSPYGLNCVITLPDGESSQLEINTNDWGGVEIVKGETFMIEMANGDGDLALLKSDLEGDLVYQAEVIEETPEYLLYKREIPGSGMDPEYHFLYVFNNGGDIIEIQNMKSANFNEEAIRKMLESAKSTSAKAGV